jgi:DNA-binding MarR family transcriptional regulator/N-acetylglutamate synthase-like GNAT family acetyltransferase
LRLVVGELHHEALMLRFTIEVCSRMIDSVKYLCQHVAMQSIPSGRIAAIRRFNRQYTRRIGALREGLSRSRFSLTEARVLFELASRITPTASDIGAELDLDAGYLSRILGRFERDGLLTRTPSETDRRQNVMTLTEAGRAAFVPLDQAAQEEIAALLISLPDPAQQELVASMGRIEALLGGGPPQRWSVRAPLPGDIGWVVQRHGALYAAEYGFDARFEALVARVAGEFLAQNDPAQERCWIAERDDVRLGSVFLVRSSEEVAKLRLLIVEPAARGLGIGKRLVAECIDFARLAGYRTITLWTNDILLAARGIYQAAGFRLVSSTPHQMFGPPMVGEDWVLTL